MTAVGSCVNPAGLTPVMTAFWAYANQTGIALGLMPLGNAVALEE